MRGRTSKHWWGVVLETPDAPALARFYADLLAWTVAKSEPTWATVGPPDGVAYLAFQTAPDYRRPTWPSVPGEQQMMLHLDFEVSRPGHRHGRRGGDRRHPGRPPAAGRRAGPARPGRPSVLPLPRDGLANSEPHTARHRLTTTRGRRRPDGSTAAPAGHNPPRRTAIGSPHSAAARPRPAPAGPASGPARAPGPARRGSPRAGCASASDPGSNIPPWPLTSERPSGRSPVSSRVTAGIRSGSRP